MPTATVKWVGGQTYVGTDSSKHSVVISTGKEKVGVSPAEMLLLSVASCSAVDVVSILEKKRMPLTALDIRVTGERTAEHPRYFRTIHIEYRVRGAGLAEQAVARAIELSEEKYCSVAATIRGVAEITTSYVIENERESIPTL